MSNQNSVTGKLIQMLPVESGVSKSSGNQWSKQTYIVETEGQYPKQVAITAWNDTGKAIANVKIGSIITSKIELESREHNGRWYTEVKAWKYEVQGEKSEQPAEAPKPQPAQILPEEHEDDLPF